MSQVWGGYLGSALDARGEANAMHKRSVRTTETFNNRDGWKVGAGELRRNRKAGK